MLRNTRPLWTSSVRVVAQSTSANHAARSASRKAPFTSLSRQGRSRAAVTSRVLPLTHKTAYATKHLQDKANAEEEKKWAQEKLEAHPEAVSTESSTQPLVGTDQAKKSEPVKDGLRHDLGLVKETFALSTVPKESYVLGLAGTIPYLATSLGDLYLSWAVNTTWPTSSAFLNSILIDQESAKYWVSVIEPVQLGYGAVIISFLGAIHWGLEYAEKTPNPARTRFRYGLGLLAPVVAWPTLLMPWQFGLTTQFAAFVGLYFADSRAAVRGWAPYWYGTYRFVLTAIVGAAIMISLIGRMKVGDTAPRLSGLGEKFHETRGEEPYTQKWAEKEQVELEKNRKIKAAEEKKKEAEEAAKKAEEEAKKASEDVEAQKGGKKGKGDKKKADNKKDGGDDKKEGDDKDSKKGDDKKEGADDKKKDDEKEEGGDKEDSGESK